MGVLESDREGVTKFRLRYTQTDAFPAPWIQTLDAWRRVLFDLGLIGEEPTEAGPIGFGNVSEKRAPGHDGRPRFLITATQTGGKPRLTGRDYSLVTDWDLARNTVCAQGPAPPSSESLTHAALYTALAPVRFVFHAHSPPIWAAAERLGLTVTARHIPYGTPAIAREVQTVLTRLGSPRTGLLVMGGHRDGVLAFGERPEDAADALTRALARARALSSDA